LKKPIIVGYDPGTTAALAIIDTEGEILFLKSKRSFKKGEIIDIITDMGKPLLIAGDRRPLPKSVERMARSLGCRPFYPKKSLSITDKKWIVREFKDEIEDDHEKDALASALYAFKHYSGVFKRTNEILKSQGLSKLYDRVVESVVTGEVENIAEAINRMLKANKEVKIPKIDRKVLEEKRALGETVSKLQEKIKRLERDIQIFKESNERWKKRLKISEKDIRYYRKKLDEKIDLGSLASIKKKTDQLKIELEESLDLIEKLRLFRKIELKGYYPIIELEEIRNGITKDLDQSLNLEDRVIIAETIVNAQILNDYNIKALISSEEPSEEVLEKVDFPVIIKKDISVEKMKNISVIKKQELEECIKKARKTGFVQLLKAHKKRRL